MKKSALLIIDIQKDFTESSGRLPVDPNHAEQIISNINSIIASAETIDLLPVYIGNEYRKYDPLNVFRNFASLEASEGSKLDPRLQVKNSHYFSKQTENAFSNSFLVEFLRTSCVEYVYLCGLYAEACVFKTFQGPRKLGLASSIVRDAIASKTENRRQSMLIKYARLGANFVSTSELVKQQ